jgi:hypothetical protein
MRTRRRYATVRGGAIPVRQKTPKDVEDAMIRFIRAGYCPRAFGEAIDGMRLEDVARFADDVDLFVQGFMRPDHPRLQMIQALFPPGGCDCCFQPTDEGGT